MRRQILIRSVFFARLFHFCQSVSGAPFMDMAKKSDMAIS